MAKRRLVNCECLLLNLVWSISRVFANPCVVKIVRACCQTCGVEYSGFVANHRASCGEYCVYVAKHKVINRGFVAKRAVFRGRLPLNLFCLLLARLY